MKKIISGILLIMMMFSFVACGNSNENKTVIKEEKVEPLSLDGKWKEADSDSKDSWQEAEIENGVITVNWVSDKGETKSIYWIGSYEAPKSPEKEYKWTSTRDKEKTDSALLSSQDDTKEFSYDGKTLNYQVSLLGTTTTVHLKPVK